MPNATANVAAVDQVDLRIEDGEYVTILGPSGCGKTTLIRMIAGIIDAHRGKVFIGGKDMNGVPIEERDIGYVFQNIALFPNLNVQPTTSPTAPGSRARRRRSRSSIAHKYLELVKLLDKMDMFPARAVRGGAAEGVLGPGAGHRFEADCCWTSRSPPWTPG